MGRLERSFLLGKLSWRVLRSDRGLALFPVLAALGSLLALGVFGGLIAATGLDTDGSSKGLEPIGWVFVVLLYVALAAVTTYFQAALVLAANERLQGGETSVGQALDAATSKLHRILPWAIFQATVSMVVQAIEERAGWLGVAIARLFGAAWAVVTFLAVPVIVLEDVGPVDGLKRSGHLLRQTWGENLSAQFGFGALAFLGALPGVGLLGAGIGSGEIVVAVVLGTLGALWIAAVSVVISAMTGIYKTALYRYAVDGRAPAGFADTDLADAFRPRGG